MGTVHERPGHKLLRQTESVAAHVGMELLGSVCLVTGILMTLTLFLLPLGIPLALLGVSCLVDEMSE
ncbi:MAG: hypothetical protein CMJ48_02490 [Planctomycetaceae bacterium]|nr:hypothetical protein [Planctomycetaceae bacterium]